MATDFHKTKNFCTTTVATEIDDNDTSLVVADASDFPDPGADSSLYYYVVLGSSEVVEVTDKESNTLTIARAKDGSSATTHIVGTTVRLAPVKGNIDEIQEWINDFEDNSSTVISGITVDDDITVDTGETADIGATDHEFRDGYFDGTVYCADLVSTSTIDCVDLDATGLVTTTEGFLSTELNPASVPTTSDYMGFGYYSATGDGYLICGHSADFIDWSNAEDINIIAKNMTIGVNGTSVGHIIYGSLNTYGYILSTAPSGDVVDFKLRDTDTGHGLSDLANTNDVLRMYGATGADGGIDIRGFSAASTQYAMKIGAYMGGGGSVTVPALVLNAADRSGTGVASLTADEIVLEVRNNETEIMTVYGDGDVAIDGKITCAGALTSLVSLTVGGGYGDTGVSITAAGAISTNDSVIIDGELTIGGGYAGGSGSTLTTAGNIQLNGDITGDGDITLTGDLSCADITMTGTFTLGGCLCVEGGTLSGGEDGVEQGVLVLWDGADGTTPGYIKIHTPNGTAWYIYVQDDGDVRIHNAVPTANGQGDPIGTQN